MPKSKFGVKKDSSADYADSVTEAITSRFSFLRTEVELHFMVFHALSFRGNYSFFFKKLYGRCVIISFLYCKCHWCYNIYSYPLKLNKGLMDHKKKAIIREYRKLQKKKGSHTRYREDRSDSYEHGEDQVAFFQRAVQEYEEKRKRALMAFQRINDKRKERDEALRKYTEKKRENFKKISRKTKWGQPVMSGRIEILVEKIQKSVKIEN